MIYISTNCLREKDSVFVRDVFKVLEIYKRIGVKNIELGSVHSGKTDVNGLRGYKKENDANFIVHGFFPPAEKRFILNIASRKEAVLKKTLNFMKNSIDVCHEIGAALYSFHLGYTSEINLKFEPIGKPYPYEVVFETAVHSIQLLADYACDYGIKIAVENMNCLRDSVRFFCKKDEFERLFKEVNKTNVGLLLDTGHLHFASKVLKFNKDEFIKQLKSRIFEIHVQKPGKELDDHLKIDEETVMDMLKYFDKDELKGIKLTLESVRLNEKDILDCKRILENFV